MSGLIHDLGRYGLFLRSPFILTIHDLIYTSSGLDRVLRRSIQYVAKQHVEAKKPAYNRWALKEQVEPVAQPATTVTGPE